MKVTYKNEQYNIGDNFKNGIIKSSIIKKFVIEMDIDKTNVFALLSDVVFTDDSTYTGLFNYQIDNLVSQ